MTARGVRFRGPGDVALDDIHVPAPRSGEVRIRPAAVGVCGTDAKIVEGSFDARPGVVLGHEIAGFVEALGEGVTTVREGDLVAVEPHLFCGQCRYCRRGAEHLCLEKRAFGVHLDGGMADLLNVPARLAYVVNASIDPTIACLAEPLGCAIHGMDRLDPASGLSVLIMGAGPAGLMLASISRLAGLTPIVIVEPDGARRTAARSMGADFAIDPAAEGWRESALALTQGHGFDYAIESSGSPGGLTEALALSARGARILVYGVARPQDEISLRPQQVYAKELTILGSAINPFTHARAIELLGELRLDVLRPATYSLESFSTAFDAQRRRDHLKVVLTPQA
ncbi:MAG TPA: alcohol dehydrogenase catalytic domain-containing protein [Candidatus Limnocylindrales bacterium]|nr:alcohol dehydrogenase catalytic domain-containing protein [Candidatus Limnocylindrales bacterium]